MAIDSPATPGPGPSLQSSLDDDDRVFDEIIARDARTEPDDKLAREIYVIGGGTIDAAKHILDKNTLASTALEVAGSAVAGFAIRAAEAELPALRPALAIGGAALTFSFARDVLSNSGKIGDIISDTWNNKDHEVQNRAAFADHGGKFGIDLALSTGAALTGSALAERMLFGPTSNYTRIATYDGPGLLAKESIPHNRLYSNDDPVGKLFADNKGSTMYLVGYKNGAKTNANAFVISDDGMVMTNHHAVHGKTNLRLTDSDGKTHSATVLASDKAQDLAVLQIQNSSPGTVFRPVKLAQADFQPGDPLYLLTRHRGGTEPAISSGKVRDLQTLQLSPKEVPPGVKKTTVTITLTPFSRELRLSKPSSNPNLVDAPRVTGNYFSKPGVSGSPVFNANGEVAGVHNGTLGSWFTQLTARNCFVPISSSTKVIEAALANRTKMF